MQLYQPQGNYRIYKEMYHCRVHYMQYELVTGHTKSELLSTQSVQPPNCMHLCT